MSGYGRFSLPLASPMETSRGRIDRREGYLVRVGDGPVGVGEATPLAGWTEGLAACRGAIDGTIGELASFEGPDDLGAMAERPAARHGLELALLDRSARAAGEPLYRHLGGQRRVSTLPVNATVGDGTVEETASACAAAAEAGYPAVKVKVGARAVEADLDRLRAARDAAGEGLELRADANGAWSRAEADRALQELSTVGVSLLEQPLSPEDVEGAAALRGRGVEIGADEALIARSPAAVLEAGAADVLVLKPMVLGGPSRAVDGARAAVEAGVGAIVSTTIDAAVARTAAVHVAAALDLDRPCGLATADRLAGDVGSDPAPVVDGGISVPQGAGHGVGVEELE